MPLDALDPTWIDAPGGGGPTYNSEELRRDIGFLLAGGVTPDVSRSGVLDTRALTVSLSGSNVQINPGGAAVGTGKGAYLTGASATATVDALVAADVTNPRRDRVVLEILDPDNGGGAGRKAQFRVIAGTPSATAASGGGYPAAPSSPSITLAYIDVPKSGAGSPSVTDQRPYTAAAGGVIPVRDAADLATVTKVNGRQAFRLDKGWVETCDGTNWNPAPTRPHSEWTFGQSGIPSATVYGTNVLTIDSAASTDTAFVSCPSADLLTIRDAGIYDIHLIGNWNTANTGRGFSQITDSTGNTVHARSSISAAELVGSVNIPNFRCAANTTIKLSTYLTFASGLSTWQGRVRVTRIG